MNKYLIILVFILLFAVYYMYDQKESTNFDKLKAYAELDSLRIENGNYKKLAKPLLSNSEINSLKKEFDGLNDELKKTKGDLLIAQKATIKYKTISLTGVAKKDTIFINDTIVQYKFVHKQNEMLSAFGWFRTNGEYEMNIEQKPLTLELSYIKTDRGIQAMVTPNFSDVKITNIDTYYPIDTFYDKKPIKYIPSLFWNVNSASMSYGLSVKYNNLIPTVIIGANTLLGAGYEF